MASEDEVVKIIVIGDSMVGKTSFIHRYVNNTYRGEYKSTIGVDFALKMVRWNDSSMLKLQLWDIAGQERFTFMTRAYYKEARGCLLMFDVTNSASFHKVIKWKSDLDAKAKLTDGSNIPCLLVANKCDVGDPEVSHSEISALCADHGFVGWTETSVKEDVMVRESVTYLLDVIKGRSHRRTDIADFTDSVVLKKQDLKKTGCSCHK